MRSKLDPAVTTADPSPLNTSRRELLTDALAIAVVHAVIAIGARAFGFDHVSDDDFARVTIAQSFAHAPKLDPSGTSWLPFPFWILGSSMLAFGRSLATARGLSIVFASLAAALPYLALRLTGAPRGRSLIATAFAFATPWAIWLGASTVPESFTASLTASAAIALGSRAPSPRARIAFACALLAACLSRYEPWPVAAVLAVVLGLRARRDASHRVLILCCALAVLGPLLWMAWNAHAHDGPLHFFRRVSNFKRAIGEGSTSTLEAALQYPWLLIARRPEVALVSALLLLRLGDPELRARWLVPLLTVLGQLLFLGAGNARDGAPAHHPERALLGAMLVLALFTIDAGGHVLPRLPRMQKLVGLAGISMLWLVMTALGLASPPGKTASEDRGAQIERGERLKAQGVVSIIVTPCAFEHFALIAAYGAPERAVIQSKTGASVTPECPDVEAFIR